MKLGCANSTEINLNNTINYINELHENDSSVLAAVITGDIGKDPENLFLASNLLRKLDIPYYIAPGNHDIKTYKDFQNEGMNALKEAFRDYIPKTVRENTMDVDVQPPGRPEPYNLMNYEFNIPGYNSVRFLTLDFTNRFDPNRCYNTSNWPVNCPDYYYRPQANVHDFKFGTLRWMKDRIASLVDQDEVKKIVFLQHHPFKTYPTGYDYDKDGRTMFTEEDYLKVFDAIKESAGSNIHKIYGGLVGHFHYFKDHHPFGTTSWEHPSVQGLEHYRELMTDDSNCWPHYQVIEVNTTEGAELFTYHRDSSPEPIENYISCTELDSSAFFFSFHYLVILVILILIF